VDKKTRETWAELISLMDYMGWEPEQVFEAFILFQEIVMDNFVEDDIECAEDVLNGACEVFKKKRKGGLA